MRTKSKWQLPLLLSLILVLSAIGVACQQPAPVLKIYDNQDWGYSIKYPEGWTKDKIAVGVSGIDTTILQAPTRDIAGIGITIYDLNITELEGDAEETAQGFLQISRERYDSVLVLDNSEMQGKWSWHLLLELDGIYNQETFFLRKDGFLCCLQINCPGKDYDRYPWDEIIESFAFEPPLLTEG